MARAKQPPRVRTKQDPSTKVEDEAPVPTDDESIPETEIDALGEAEDAAPGEVEDEAPVVTEAPVAAEVEAPIEVEARSENGDLIAVEAPAEAQPGAEAENLVSSGLGEDQLQPLAAEANIHVVSYNTVLSEATDYSKTSLKNNCIFVKEILGAKSFESAVRIQSDYAKTSYIDFVTYLTRILAIYSKLTHSAFERRSHIA